MPPFGVPLTCATLRSHPLGQTAGAMLAAALTAVEPAAALRNHLGRAGDELIVGTERFSLDGVDRIIILAAGKAAAPMAAAALSIIGNHSVTGLVVTKDEPEGGFGLPAAIEVVMAGHPVPDERSVEAGERALRLLQTAGPRDLVLGLISGGGSALMTAPLAGLSLADMQHLTGTLLRVGAPIEAINALRRRCDRVKGGGLLAAAGDARVAVLILSDVLGDDLRSIASGPFVAGDDQNTVEGLLRDYDLQRYLPPRLLDCLRHPPSLAAPRREAAHTIIANVWTAVQAAATVARAHGLAVTVRAQPLLGEARLAGPMLIDEFAQLGSTRPTCYLAGGETTVTIRGAGLGGRNQELALATVEPLAGRDLLLVALATDGGDGPTDAAGAAVDGETMQQARAHGLDPDGFLARNDAYHFFDALDDLLRPGPTLTNVNDLTLLIAP